MTTDGTDLTAATGGVALNFILRSGTNVPHGSTRWYYEDEKMQSNNMPSDLAVALGSPNGKGNRTDLYRDYGFEIGGPIFRDRLWAWGSMGGPTSSTSRSARRPTTRSWQEELAQAVNDYRMGKMGHLD